MNLIDKNEKFPDNCCQQDLTTLLTTCVGYTKIIRSPPPLSLSDPRETKKQNKNCFNLLSLCRLCTGEMYYETCQTRINTPRDSHD